MTALAISLWLHLFAPPGCGVPVDEPVAVEVAPMPRPVPRVGIPNPVHPPKHVRPWKPPADRR